MAGECAWNVPLLQGGFASHAHKELWTVGEHCLNIRYLAGCAIFFVFQLPSKGKEGNAGMLAYSTSKAGVIGLTKVIGKEYAETGITCNAVAPAVVRTAMVSDLIVFDFTCLSG